MFPPYQSSVLNRWTTGLKSGCRLEAISHRETLDIAAIPPVSCLLSDACLLTRVGFEPNLSSLKGWQPHQKSNGPCCARTGCANWVERWPRLTTALGVPPRSSLGGLGCFCGFSVRRRAPTAGWSRLSYRPVREKGAAENWRTDPDSFLLGLVRHSDNRSGRTSAPLLAAQKMNFSYQLNGDRDSVLRQSLSVFRNPSESALCFDSQSPAGKLPTKAGLGTPGRQSPTVSQLRAVNQLVAVRLWRTAVTRLCTDNSASTACISQHPSGAPAWRAPMDAS